MEKIYHVELYFTIVLLLCYHIIEDYYFISYVKNSIFVHICAFNMRQIHNMNLHNSIFFDIYIYATLICYLDIVPNCYYS